MGFQRFINGEFVEGVDKKKFEVINPATEEVITSVCEATEKDVDIAVVAARKAFNTTWRKTATVDRGRMLLKLADLIDRDAKKLAAVESYNNGKPISLATGELQLVSACIRYYGGWADKIHGKTIDIDTDYMVYTKYEPVSEQAYLRTAPPGNQITNRRHSRVAWCLRSDHSLELPPAHACMEDWPLIGHR